MRTTPIFLVGMTDTSKPDAYAAPALISVQDRREALSRYASSHDHNPAFLLNSAEVGFIAYDSEGTKQIHYFVSEGAPSSFEDKGYVRLKDYFNAHSQTVPIKKSDTKQEAVTPRSDILLLIEKYGAKAQIIF